MNFVLGTLGELLIIQFHVLYIWMRVLMDNIKHKEANIEYKRLLLTSLGLVFNAISIIGIIGYRIYELVTDNWPFVAGIVAYYVLQASGGILLIISAALGTRLTVLSSFCTMSIIWTIIVFGTNFIG